jgi:hypothetical protein
MQGTGLNIQQQKAVKRTAHLMIVWLIDKAPNSDRIEKCILPNQAWSIVIIIGSAAHMRFARFQNKPPFIYRIL